MKRSSLVSMRIFFHDDRRHVDLIDRDQAPLVEIRRYQLSMLLDHVLPVAGDEPRLAALAGSAGKRRRVTLDRAQDGGDPCGQRLTSDLLQQRGFLAFQTRDELADLVV